MSTISYIASYPAYFSIGDRFAPRFARQFMLEAVVLFIVEHESRSLSPNSASHQVWIEPHSLSSTALLAFCCLMQLCLMPCGLRHAHFQYINLRRADGAREREKVMLFRQNVVVRLWPRVATVSAAVRTLTSRITVRDAVAATSTREDVSVLVSHISVYYSAPLRIPLYANYRVG